jgi:hypothetical protein
MSKRSRMHIRRSKSFASGFVLDSKRSNKARRIMSTFDPVSFACLQQLSMKHDIPVSAIIRFAVEIYLTGNQDNDIAKLAAKIRENRLDEQA